jgi:hypothetical protein
MYKVDYQLTLERDVFNALEKSPVLFLLGPEGHGKRTVLKRVCKSLSMTFLVIPGDTTPKSLCNSLFGHTQLANPAISESGLLAQEGICIYINGAENFPADLFPLLKTFLINTSYLGMNRYKIDQLIIFSINNNLQGTSLQETNTIILRNQSVKFPEILSPKDIYQVACSIMKENNLNHTLRENDFINIRLPREGLWSLKKWIINADISGAVKREQLVDEMAKDIRPFLDRFEYRGRLITYDEFEKWVRQFPLNLRPIINRIVRVMVEREYIIPPGVFHAAINNVVRKSAIKQGRQVILCEWQKFGKSGAIMTHSIKERGNWGRASIELDLNDKPAIWAKSIEGKKLPAILVDDFTGTGGSIEEVLPRLDLLLEAFPDLDLYIIFIMGFSEGLSKLRDLEVKFDRRVKIIIWRSLNYTDTCFHQQSTILIPAERKLLEDYCVEFGKEVKTRFPKGFGELGTLIIFPESIPNTTLPIFWFDSKPDKWKPLTPASMFEDIK